MQFSEITDKALVWKKTPTKTTCLQVELREREARSSELERACAERERATLRKSTPYIALYFTAA